MLLEWTLAISFSLAGLTAGDFPRVVQRDDGMMCRQDVADGVVWEICLDETQRRRIGSLEAHALKEGDHEEPPSRETTVAGRFLPASHSAGSRPDIRPSRVPDLVLSLEHMGEASRLHGWSGACKLNAVFATVATLFSLVAWAAADDPMVGSAWRTSTLLGAGFVAGFAIAGRAIDSRANAHLADARAAVGR